MTIRPEYLEETPEDFERATQKYIQYAPPSWFGTDIHFDRRRIEYSIDDEDLQWLAQQRIPETELDEEAMEILMDVLEKESFRQLEFRQINAQVAPVEPVDDNNDEDDEPCSVCAGKDWDEENLMVYCEGCNMPIHQACQDLAVIPDGDWYCDTCTFRMHAHDPIRANSNKRGSVTSPVQSKASSTSKSAPPTIDFSILLPCVICGMVDGGPMKKTNIPGRFAHLVCALMHPDVWFENDQANVSRVLSSKSKVVCSLCGHPGGLVKCSHRGCNVQYHVMCARENGQQLMFNVPDPDEEEELEKAELQEALSLGTSTSSVTAPNSNHGKTHMHVHLQQSGAHGHGEEMDVDIDEISEDTNPLNSLNTSTTSMASEKEAKKKRKKKSTKKKVPHQPYQSLCAMHSGAIRAEKLEAARKASLAIPVEIGRFLKEEDAQVPGDVVVGDTTTFSKALDIIQKAHTSKIGFSLTKPAFERVVAYWKAKRLAHRLGHMPFIFQLHVLVTHFKEDFDAGRKLESEPRQVEMILAQYTAQKKFEILKQLRDSVEILRTTLDLVKKREVKKRLAVLERLTLFDEVMKSENKAAAIRAIFAPSNRTSGASRPFSMGKPKAPTIKLPVALVKRVLATSSSSGAKSVVSPVMTSVTTMSRSIALPSVPFPSPPPKKKVMPKEPPTNEEPATNASQLHKPTPLPSHHGLTPASSSLSSIVPQTIVAPPISSLPKRSASPPVVKMAGNAALIRNSPSPKPMINSMVTAVPPLSKPHISHPPSPGSPKAATSPQHSKITSYFSPAGAASPPFKQESTASNIASPSILPHVSSLPSMAPSAARHSAVNHSTPSTPPRPSTAPSSAASSSNYSSRSSSNHSDHHGSSSSDVTSQLDVSTHAFDSSKMDVSVVSEHAPSISTLSSPMVTPTKLSRVKLPSSPPVPLATSSPKPMTPISSPKPAPTPILLDVAHFEAYPMDEENILFNSDISRSIFDSPNSSTRGSNKPANAMEICNQ